jgi:hypothetical protein
LLELALALAHHGDAQLCGPQLFRVLDLPQPSCQLQP